jgi:hypothetical protein
MTDKAIWQHGFYAHSFGKGWGEIAQVREQFMNIVALQKLSQWSSGRSYRTAIFEANFAKYCATYEAFFFQTFVHCYLLLVWLR